MKNIKRYLVALLVVTILVASIGLYACNNNDDIPPCTLALTQFYTKNQNPFLTDYFDVETKLNFTEKINSVEELKVFCQQRQFQVFDEENKKFNSDRVSKKLREYDEEFFKKRSVVLMFRLKETLDFYGHTSANIEDGVMTINLATVNGNNTTAERTQIRIWEINKNVAKEINQIKVEERLGELDQKVGIKIYEYGSLKLKEDYPDSFIINSIEELNNLCNEETSDCFDFDPFFHYSNDKIIAILKQYDEEFFKEKSFVLFIRGRASSAFFYRFKNYEINENSINITLSRSLPKEPDFYPDDFILCAYIIEMNKEMASNINQININEIEE